jgi:tetratricopeptide (TPR) repeat protein
MKKSLKKKQQQESVKVTQDNQNIKTQKSTELPVQPLQSSNLFDPIKLLAIFGLIALVTVIIYSNHFNNTFHFDDAHTILENSYIKDIRNFPLFFTDGSTFSSLPSNRSYRPLITASIAFDYWLGKGPNPFYFHLSMFSIFILQGLMLIFIYWKIADLAVPSKLNFSIAAITTAWYMLHPVNGETINYIISRTDSYSTFFFVLAFSLYLYSPFCKKWHLYLIPVLIGGLAKEPVIMFASILFMYQLCFEQQMDLKKLLEGNKKELDKLKPLILSCLPAILCCVALIGFLNVMRPKSFTPGGYSLFSYVLIQPYVILHYVASLFFPFWLSIDADWGPLDTVFDIRVLVGVSFIVFLVYLIFLTSQKQKLRPICFGLSWFLLALLPTSLIPLAEVLNYHRPFFPYIGLILAVCWAVFLLLQKYEVVFLDKPLKTQVVLVVSAVILFYGIGTHQRNKLWATDEAIWKDATIKSPKNGRAWMSYGLTLMNRGDYENAEKQFLEAMKFVPYYSYLYVNLGVLKQKTGFPAEADNYFKKAVEYGADHPTVFYFYGAFLKEQNRVPEAIDNLTKGLALAPNHVGTQRLLMTIYQEQGDFAKLETLAQQILKQTPDNTEAKFYLDAAKNKKTPLQSAVDAAYNNKTPEGFLELSLKYYQLGNYEKCIESANEALKLKPDFAEAYNNIGTAYNGLKQWDKAIEACEKAVQLKPDFQLAKNNLAWAKDQKAKDNSPK